MIMHDYLNGMEYGKPYSFGVNWYIIKYRKNKLHGDRFLLLGTNSDDEIEDAIYGRMIDYELNFLSVKGKLLNKDTCENNNTDIKTYKFGKSWYLMTCPKELEEKLANEAKKLLSELDTYFLKGIAK